MVFGQLISLRTCTIILVSHLKSSIQSAVEMVCVLVAQSCPALCEPLNDSCQAPLPMEFSRQEYWSGSPFPSPEDLPDPGIELGLWHCRQILYHLSYKGSLM